MERMDRARRIGGVLWVVIGAAATGAWTVMLWATTATGTSPGVATGVVAAVITAGTLAACVAGSPVTRWWGARVAGAVIGTELLGAVADRFGLFGAYGAPGVSWGDWSHFRTETAALVPWASLVEPAAVAATVAELTLGALLVAGVWWRWVGKATAALFAVYLVAMVPAMGPASLLQFGVPVIVGGALVSSARGSWPTSARSRTGRDRTQKFAGFNGATPEKPQTSEFGRG